ncbi:Sensory transduction protein kinase [Granulibacter bethesdensis]|uniref:histidine kinase n=2 Tax=Granulibacter bethesdensis TaxID=364410 RepID=A0AAN0VGZ6_9PROT|nr:Sensory transduction protein kinase [Granulibacter bethesdensis]
MPMCPPESLSGCDDSAPVLFPDAAPGEIITYLRAMDWDASLIGPPENWSEPFRNAVALMLNAKAQIAMFCGPELIALYNDAYAPAIGGHHPAALGRPAQENWQEIWDVLEPLLRSVMETGQTVYGQNYPFRVNRHGYMEEVFFDISYSPVHGPDGKVEAVFCIVADRTQRVIDDRRLRTLQAISLNILSNTVESCATSALDILARESTQDIPHAALYIRKEAPERLDCIGWYGAQPATLSIPLVQHTLPAAEDVATSESWKNLIRAALDSGNAVYGPSGALFPTLPALSAERMAILPLQVTHHIAGVLIAGKSRLYPPDAEYYRFFQLVANLVSTGLTTAIALREQRHRAKILEQKVAAAIAEREISETRLRQAQKMEMIGRLAGGVAHDFNNLLQVIGSNLELTILQLPETSAERRRLTSALEAMQRGSRLASQMLAFGRRQPLSPQAVSPSRLLQTVQDILLRTLGAGITLRIHTAPDSWNIRVDRGQIEAAILNLTLNARDAMKGHGSLTITTANTVVKPSQNGSILEIQPGDYVTLTVTDTGCGMAPDVITHVFEPFFTTKSEGQGTGLGMSMVYGFVKQSGGDIRIDSAPGRGTSISLILPRADEEDSLSDTPLLALDNTMLEGHETILVVEDEDAVRQSVQETLSQLGYNVLTARDADEALAILDSTIRIDLVFTDIIMPGTMRGTDLAVRIRQLRPETAILFTSGYTDSSVHRDDDNPIQLLNKPYSRDKLAHSIRAALITARSTPSFPHTASLQTAGDVLSSSHSLSSASPQQQWTILVTEDDPLIRMNLIDLLEEAGHSPIEAENAEEALSYLKTHSPDILFTDISLPGLSGVELACLARERYPSIGIIFSSGYADVPGLPAEMKQNSCLLGKPFTSHELVKTLLQAWENRPAQGTDHGG